MADTLGRRAYRLRASGMTWPDIAAELYDGDRSRAATGRAHHCAASYATGCRKPWPLAGPTTHRQPLVDADLTRPTADLVREYGVTPEAVRQAKIRRGIPTARWGTLAGADLTRPAEDLAAEYGVTVGAVYNARGAAGVHVRRSTWTQARPAPFAGLRAKAKPKLVTPEPVVTPAVAVAPPDDLDALIAEDLLDGELVPLIALRRRVPAARVEAIKARLEGACAAK